jgi:membrane complex biogenesis BtpA family protein
MRYRPLNGDDVKHLIGVVHFPSLPGSPGYAGERLETIIASCQADLRALERAGFDGVIFENFGDTPFFKETVPAVTLTTMTRVIVGCGTTSLKVGVNVLRNDASGALAVAAATGADFIRVNVHVGTMATDQGIIEGQAAQTCRLRSQIIPGCQIFADVAVKHATPVGSEFNLIQTAKDTLYRGRADAIIMTGSGTGQGTDLSEVAQVREALPDSSIYVGSGVTHESVVETLRVADGVIVGTALKVDGRVANAIDIERAEAFARLARAD